jgi:hypothetical protein
MARFGVLYWAQVDIQCLNHAWAMNGTVYASGLQHGVGENILH